jgi:flagellar M-ring protein FliF
MAAVAEVGTGSLMEGFSNLPILRQIGLMIGLAASVAVGFGVVLWSQEPDYRPLYTDLSHMDANQVTAILAAEEIGYKIDTDKGILLVEAPRIHDARMKLASAGLSSTQGAGYELLDKGSALGTSQFMEKARYQRSLEGELARTIASLRPVKSARVHLALPKRSVFITDRRKPRASVLVDLYPGARLSQGQVASIVHLVASSISELDSKQVTVVDQQGNLLSDSDPDSDIALASKQYEYVRNIEKKYLASINNILETIVGKEAFKVEINADVDFTREEQTAEQFNPDLPAVRSEQIFEQQSGTALEGGVPGALANQPEGAGRAPEVGQGGEGGGEGGVDRRVSRTSVKNFELDRTISYTQRQVGQLRRLSVAVVLDDLPGQAPLAPADGEAQAASGEDGEALVSQTRQPIPAAMLENITQLVKDAVGYDPSRGDRVVVLNQPFMAPDEQLDFEVEPVPFYEADWFVPAMKMAFGWLVAIIIMLGVLRPILRNLSAFSTSAQDMEMSMPDLPALDEPEDSSTPPEILLPGPEESYEAQLNAVKSMVAEDPRRVAQVVKTWLNE